MSSNLSTPTTPSRTPGSQGSLDLVVVGAGLAGLSAAVTAARAGASVVLCDAGRPGGRARTTTVDPGAVLNAGPRALYRGGAAARELAALGVRWTGHTPPTRGACVRVGSRTHTMPGTAGQLLRTGALGTASKVRVGWTLATIGRLDPSGLAGRSVTDWVRSTGMADDAAALLHAVVRLATYVDAPDQLDAGAAVAQVQLALDGGVEYLDGGWQVLVDQLVDAARAAGVEVRAHASVQSVDRQDDSWVVDLGDEQLHTTSVVLASGTPAAAAALSPVPLPLDALGEPAGAACLELVLRGSAPTAFLLGVDRPLYLSQHAPAARLAPPDTAVVHVIRYGARDRHRDRAQLWEHAELAGITREQVLAERFLAHMVVSGGVPLAAGGGLAGRPAVAVAGADGLLIAGDWVGDEGLLADAAVASGVRAGALAAERARTRVRMVS
jgi:glycine/D-amino acid oxidase-like deaminating enzyme